MVNWLSIFSLISSSLSYDYLQRFISLISLYITFACTTNFVIKLRYTDSLSKSDIKFVCIQNVVNLLRLNLEIIKMTTYMALRGIWCLLFVNQNKKVTFLSPIRVWTPSPSTIIIIMPDHVWIRSVTFGSVCSRHRNALQKHHSEKLASDSSPTNNKYFHWLLQDQLAYERK